MAGVAARPDAGDQVLSLRNTDRPWREGNGRERGETLEMQGRAEVLAPTVTSSGFSKAI